MIRNRPHYTRAGFLVTYGLPACLIFVPPILGLLFFSAAPARLDQLEREAALRIIQRDHSLSHAERELRVRAVQDMSLAKAAADPRRAPRLSETTRLSYGSFHALRAIAWVSILGSVAAFVGAGGCVFISLYSQHALYRSLAASWYVLQIFGAVQAVLLGLLAIGFAYWAPILWFSADGFRWAFGFAFVTILGLSVFFVRMFRQTNFQLSVAGMILRPDPTSRFQQRLVELCERVGATLPQNIVAGIDDNFFVVEAPIIVDGHRLRGSTLFVSLALLKQMNATEADAVLVHELAHFTGQDTYYSRRIAPLVGRFDQFLDDLVDGFVSWPIVPFVRCVRALFELSLRRHGRQRELRADKIAAEVTSPNDFAAGLLRTAAYQRFRCEIEAELFSRDERLATADISARIAAGFPEFARAFADDPNWSLAKSAHPLDSHPSLWERLKALGVAWSADEARELLCSSVDGGRYHDIPEAEIFERIQWANYETTFRQLHETNLAFRYLPENEEQRLVVARTFPEVNFEGGEGKLTIHCEAIRHATWPDALEYREIKTFTLNERSLQIDFVRNGPRSRTIRLRHFSAPKQEEILAKLNGYLNRYRAAADYRRVKTPH